MRKNATPSQAETIPLSRRRSLVAGADEDEGLTKQSVNLVLPTASDLAQLLAHPMVPAISALGSAARPASSLAWGRAVGKPAPNPFRHPDANREIVLEGLSVAFHFAHAQRQTIGMRVDPKGLHVRAPRWATPAQVQAVLRSKAGWILSKLEQLPKFEQQTVFLGAGGHLRVLGRSILLQGWSDPSLKDPRCVSSRLRTPASPDHALVLELDLPDGDPRWPLVVQRWLQALAHRYFVARLDAFAPQMGVTWQRLRLSNAKTRWGSASSNGTIRLHWRLIQLSPDVVDYVVVHELAHLREMNHSARFWAIVREHMPEFETHRSTLKQVRLATLG